MAATSATPTSSTPPCSTSSPGRRPLDGQLLRPGAAAAIRADLRARSQRDCPLVSDVRRLVVLSDADRGVRWELYARGRDRVRVRLFAWRRADGREGHSMARVDRLQPGGLFQGTEVLTGTAETLACSFRVWLNGEWETCDVEVVAR